MIKLENLTEKDCDKYLENGFLTESFLKVEYISEKMQKDKES